jgi:hypothetical protein
MKRHLLRLGLAVSLITTSCMEEDSEPKGQSLSINVTQAGMDYLFAGLPISFRISPENYSYNDAWSVQWYFGDGNTATSNGLYHTYYFPGTYKVTALTENPHTSLDTLLTVLPERKRIGESSASENGKYLYENPNGGYNVIHTWNAGSSSDTWKFLQVTSSFDSAKTEPLAFGSYPNVKKMFVNSRGNLMILEENLWEFDRSGAVINKGWNTNFLLDIIETENGYVAAGYQTTTTLKVIRFDSDLNVIDEKTLDIHEEGFVPTSFALENGGRIRMMYIEDSLSEFRLTKMVLRQLDGERLAEKDFEIDEPVTYSTPMSSGTLYRGISVVNSPVQFPEHLLVKTDLDGIEEWTIRISITDPNFGYQHDSEIDVQEVGDHIYIFSSALMVAKMTKTGQLLWHKQYGTGYDTFNSVIRNSRGNFVMLGSQQFDYATREYTNEYWKRDLVFLEVDPDGNVVID